MQLARWKLGKKTYPNHGRHNCPTVAMVPSSRHHHKHKLANKLHDKSMPLKLKKILLVLLFISYFKARGIVDAPHLCICGLRQWAALRV
jgi:hypothetical protein